MPRMCLTKVPIADLWLYTMQKSQKSICSSWLDSWQCNSWVICFIVETVRLQIIYHLLELTSALVEVCLINIVYLKLSHNLPGPWRTHSYTLWATTNFIQKFDFWVNSFIFNLLVKERKTSKTDFCFRQQQSLLCTGFQGTKMDHAAKEAGVSKGVFLYFYIKNKEDLFMALVTILYSVHENTMLLLRAMLQRGFWSKYRFSEFLFQNDRGTTGNSESDYRIYPYVTPVQTDRFLRTGITSGMQESEYYQRFYLFSLIQPSIWRRYREGQNEGSIL